MRWLKYSLIAVAGVVALAGVAWFWLLHTESGARSAWRFAQSLTDGQLGGVLSEGDFAGGVTVEGLQWTSPGVDLAIESGSLAVDVDWLPPGLTVGFASLQGVELTTTPVEDAPESPPTDIDALLSELELPFFVELVDLRATDISVSSDGANPVEIGSVALAGRWDETIEIRKLEVSSPDVAATADGLLSLGPAPVATLSFEVRNDRVSASGGIEGGLQDYAVEIRGTLSLPDFDPLEWVLAGTGNLEKLDVDTIGVNGELMDANGTAVLAWAEGFELTADLGVSKLVAGRLVEDWPDANTVTGRLQATVTGDAIDIPSAELRVTSTDAVVSATASMALDSGEVDGRLQWQGLGWPIAGAEPFVSSDDGDVRVGGTLDDWRVQGSIALGTPQMPDGRFRVDGAGDRDRATATIEEGRAFGGTIVGRLDYSWRDAQPWSAALTLADVTTESLLPDWPGRLSGQVDAEGTARPSTIDAELTDVQGVLRDAPFRAQGRFRHSENTTSADDLRIEHGGSRVLLDGSADTEDGLRIEASIEDLGIYSIDAAGSLKMSGRLSRLDAAPYLDLNLDSESLRFGDLRIDDLAIVNRREDGALAGFEISAAELGIGGQKIAALAVETEVLADRQRLTLSGSHSHSDVRIAVDGAFDDWRDPANSPWRGSVSDVVIDMRDRQTLQLEAPAPVTASREQLQLRNLCIADDSDSRVCAELDWSALGRLAIGAELERVPLALTEHFVETDLRFDQTIGGNLAWTRDPDRGVTGKGSLILSPGAIRSAAETGLDIATEAGRIDFDIVDNELLSGTISLPMPGTGHVDGRFSVLDVNSVTRSAIEGRLDVDLNDIGFAAYFSPLIDAAGGETRIELDVAGTTRSPVVTGTVTVSRGRISYAPIGLVLDNIDLVGNVTESRAFELSGRFSAGDGSGEIATSAELDDIGASGLHFKVKGDRLRLIDVDDVQAVATVDIDVDYREDELGINGSILIPEARIAPTNLSESRVAESEDVVIVAGRLPEADEAPAKTSELRYSGQLGLTLGDNVVVDLDVATANLTGKTTFNWQGPSMPIAEGRYDLEGSIQAFGQVLEISEGGIRFPNVEANNPNIRIRAEREIYGNSQVKRAGVLVDGAARRPTVEAYTYPLTTEERALTLLVTGSDFDYEQGVGAVDFGTYIAPRLFVSYGVGIFDRDNIISARYDLSKGFGVKASSGNRQSGVDLNYRFEN